MGKMHLKTHVFLSTTTICNESRNNRKLIGSYKYITYTLPYFYLLLAYHFKIPEDIAHLLVEACVITVCDCRKGQQQLDEASSILTTFNMELGRFQYTVMPFGATTAGDVFQRKLDECFGKLNQVIIIADDIMVVGYNPDHSDHNQAYTLACYREPRSAMSN